MLGLSGIQRQDDEKAIDIVNKTALVDIAHRVSEKGAAAIIVIINRKAD